MKIILASASPRRKELLNQIKIPFEVMVSNVFEGSPGEDEPADWVQKLALEKAQTVAISAENSIIIGADTIVVKDNKVLGKPESEDDAFNMLRFLSGSSHQVMTGIALVNTFTKGCITDVEITTVKFRKLQDEEVKAYVKSGEPMDKAGAYGIQGLGALLVDGINGCYFNVVGLPLNRLSQNLKKMGVEAFHDFT
ncbi:MAG: Maf family protein [Bacillota bacterium]